MTQESRTAPILGDVQKATCGNVQKYKQFFFVKLYRYITFRVFKLNLYCLVVKSKLKCKYTFAAYFKGRKLKYCKLMRLGSPNRIDVVESNLKFEFDRRITLIRIPTISIEFHDRDFDSKLIYFRYKSIEIDHFRYIID